MLPYVEAPRAQVDAEITRGDRSPRERPRPSPIEGPVRHGARPARDTPLIFADSATGAPDLSSLARRIHAAAPTPPREAAPAVAACFGAEQRWYLTRLALPEAPPGPRRLVCRGRFISAEDLAAWRQAPPEDAHAVAPSTDVVIDGLTPAGEVAFYALLSGPAPWRALPLAISPPPFEAAGEVVALGPAGARLEALVRERLERPPLPAALRSLLDAALAWLPREHLARRALEASALAPDPLAEESHL